LSVNEEQAAALGTAQGAEDAKKALSGWIEIGRDQAARDGDSTLRLRIERLEAAGMSPEAVRAYLSAHTNAYCKRMRELTA
jgi:hypothetical protein